jgi:hypothetical protein
LALTCFRASAGDLASCKNELTPLCLESKRKGDATRFRGFRDSSAWQHELSGRRARRSEDEVPISAPFLPKFQTPLDRSKGYFALIEMWPKVSKQEPAVRGQDFF